MLGLGALSQAPISALPPDRPPLEGAVTFAAGATFVIVGTILAAGQVGLTGSGAVAAAAAQTHRDGAALASSGNLAGTPSRMARSGSDLAVSAFVFGDPVRVARPGAALYGAGTLFGHPFSVFGPVAALSATGALFAQPQQIHLDGASLSGTSALSPIGSRMAAGILVLSASGQMQVVSIRVRPGQVSMVGRVVLEGTPTTAYAELVTNTKVQLVYAAEISPWAVSDRNAA